jgi:hypothetical protein
MRFYLEKEAIGSLWALNQSQPLSIGSPLFGPLTTGERECKRVEQSVKRLPAREAMTDSCKTSVRLTAVVVTPLLASLFGFMTSSSAATNGLLMPAQAALAQAAQVSLPWLAASQNVAAAAATMLSPIRLAMGCALVGRPDLERPVYAHAWPLGVMPLTVLVLATVLLIC